MYIGSPLTPPKSNQSSYDCENDQLEIVFNASAQLARGVTIFVALVRTSLLIDEFDSRASLAALYNSSATGVRWATHVPKTSKKRTRNADALSILILRNELVLTGILSTVALE